MATTTTTTRTTKVQRNESHYSPLLALPLEIRFLVYSFTLPGEYLPVNLCTKRNSSTSPSSPSSSSSSAPPYSTASPIAALFRQTLDFSSLIRTNGIHLLQVCKRIRCEVMPILQGLTARFHCEKCYTYFIGHVAYSFIHGPQWLHRVQIELHLSQYRPTSRRMRKGIDVIAQEAMMNMRKITWNRYGRLDLMDREKWIVQDMLNHELDEDDAGGFGGFGGVGGIGGLQQLQQQQQQQQQQQLQQQRQARIRVDRPFRLLPLHYSISEIQGALYLISGVFDTNERVEVDNY